MHNMESNPPHSNSEFKHRWNMQSEPKLDLFIRTLDNKLQGKACTTQDQFLMLANFINGLKIRNHNTA